MVFIGLLGAGLYGYLQLGLDLFPDISFPVISVSTTMEGASPEEVENLITRTVEQSVSRVAGVQSVTSTSTSGMSVVSVEFDYGDNMEQAETDIRRSLEDYSDMLPDDADDPVVRVRDPSQMPVMVIAFRSDQMNSFTLRELVEDEIDPLLNRVDGVGATNVIGGRIREIQIEPDPAKLSSLGISLRQLESALAGRNYDQPAGQIIGDNMRTSITSEISYSSVEEIGQTVVTYIGEDPVLLSSIADVIDGEKAVTGHVLVDGEECVVVAIFKRSDANTVNICDGVKEKLAEIEESYGERFSFRITMDQSEFIQDSIGNLYHTGIVALIVALLVIYAFLRSWRNSFLIGISIPVSLVFTFFIMYLADVDLNMLSLAGLVISVGMLVDNSIVVIESIHRHRQMGSDPIKAAITGSKEVAGAITSSTFTTLAVFLPVLFIPGFVGQLFRDMALTVSFSLIISLCVAISLVPALSALFSKNLSSDKVTSRGFSARLSGTFKRLHHNVLSFCLDHRKATIGITGGIFILCLLLSTTVPTILMPTMDQGEISVNYALAQGFDLTPVDSVAAEMEIMVHELIPDDDLELIFVSTGRHTIGGSGSKSINQGSIFIKLVDSDRRTVGTREYTFRLLREFASMPGVDVEIQQRGMTGSDPVAVTLFDDDMEELIRTSSLVKSEMENIDGTSGVYTSVEQRIPELAFVPDPALLALRGISAQSVQSELDLGFQGSNVSTFTEDGEEFNVLLRYSESYRNDRTSIEYSQVNGYPLLSLGTLEDRSNPENIEREDQIRTVTIASGTAPGFSSGQVGAEIEAVMENLEIGDITWEMAGEYGDQDNTFQYLIIAVLIAALLVYMVMAGQFESLREPFIIILTVPMAFIGVIAILLLTGSELSIISLIGILMLAGIAVNDGIVLVDYANQLRDSGMSVRKAIEKSASVRMRPILMTTLTTVLAMVPIALGIGQGAEMWCPLGITVIGGLISAVVLTLVVEPCLYSYTAKESKSKSMEF